MVRRAPRSSLFPYSPRVWSSNLPGWVRIPCACKLLLSEASSSSHVGLSILCVSTRFCSPELIFDAGDVSKSRNSSFLSCVESPWPCQIFHLWIFQGTGPVPNHGEWSYLASYNTRAQTNWSIQSYQWKTDKIRHIVSSSLKLQSSRPSKNSLCLYSIALWS